MSKFISIDVNTEVDVYIGDILNKIDDDELRDKAMRIYMTRRIVELKLIKQKKRKYDLGMG